MPTEVHPTTLHSRRLASAIVVNYESSASSLDAAADKLIASLQTAHGHDTNWLPEPPVAEAILSAVRFNPALAS